MKRIFVVAVTEPEFKWWEYHYLRGEIEERRDSARIVHVNPYRMENLRGVRIVAEDGDEVRFTGILEELMTGLKIAGWRP